MVILFLYKHVRASIDKTTRCGEQKGDPFDNQSQCVKEVIDSI